MLTLIYPSEREGSILGDYEILSGPMVIGLAGRWPLKQIDHNFDCLPPSNILFDTKITDLYFAFTPHSIKLTFKRTLSGNVNKRKAGSTPLP